MEGAKGRMREGRKEQLEGDAQKADYGVEVDGFGGVVMVAGGKWLGVGGSGVFRWGCMVLDFLHPIGSGGGEDAWVCWPEGIVTRWTCLFLDFWRGGWGFFSPDFTPTSDAHCVSRSRFSSMSGYYVSSIKQLLAGADVNLQGGYVSV